jgi:Flp pilus assembly protein CpaB
MPLALALRRRPRLRRGLTLAAAALIGLLVQRTVAGADAARAAWGPGTRVAVAARDLAAGEVVEEGDVRIVELPDAALPPDPLGREALGRTVRSPVLEGEVLAERRLSEAHATGVAALLDDGTRAVAVPLEPDTAPPLRTGQRVDLVAVVAGAEGEAPEAVALVEGAEVLHVGDHAATVAVERRHVPRLAAALAVGAVAVVVAPG